MDMCYSHHYRGHKIDDCIFLKDALESIVCRRQFQCFVLPANDNLISTEIEMMKFQVRDELIRERENKLQEESSM